MKRITFLPFILLLMLVALGFYSCKEENYADWKIINEAWLDKYKTDTAFQHQIDAKFFPDIYLEDTELYQTESGLCYKVIHQGVKGSPTISSRIKVSYTGRLIDGTVFDTQEKQWAYLYSWINGLVEGLGKMKAAGGSFRFFIPYELGYGEKGSGTIPPYSTLIFDIELHESEIQL